MKYLTNALYSIDPFKYKNGRINNNTLFVNMQIKLAWQHKTKPEAAVQNV
jgi:hypothetical protein